MVAQITKTLFGKTDEGEEVYKFTLVNKNDLAVEVISYGAIIIGIKCPDKCTIPMLSENPPLNLAHVYVDHSTKFEGQPNKGQIKNGKFDDITLGFDNFEGYYRLNVPYFGATIGRVCNRIAFGKFQIDGRDYQVPVNDPPNSLHGGWKGFDKYVWDYQINEESVTFSRTSSDGEEDYPGSLEIQVTYGLNDDNEIHFSVTATSDKATTINITNHSYFNLAGLTEADVLNHVAEITAESYLPSNNYNIPTGQIVSVKDEPAFDFTMAKEFGRDIKQTPNDGYDNNYCVTNPGDITKLQARVTEPNSGRGIEIYTTQPGVQLYTANGLDGGLVGKHNIAYQKYGAFCLETQNWPDAINHKNFPNSILRPGDTYNHRTVYRLFVDTK